MIAIRKLFPTIISWGKKPFLSMSEVLFTVNWILYSRDFINWFMKRASRGPWLSSAPLLWVYFAFIIVANALDEDTLVDNKLKRHLLFFCLHFRRGCWNRILLNGLAANQIQHQMLPAYYSEHLWRVINTTTFAECLTVLAL